MREETIKTILPVDWSSADRISIPKELRSEKSKLHHPKMAEFTRWAAEKTAGATLSPDERERRANEIDDYVRAQMQKELAEIKSRLAYRYNQQAEKLKNSIL